MILHELESYSSLQDDLFFWIKKYLANKASTLKLDNGYSEEDFNRDTWCQLFSDSKDSKDLKLITFNIRRNGLKDLASFSTALFPFYEYINNLGTLQSIKDIDTVVIKNYIIQEYEVYSESTKKGYYTQLKSLFKFIDLNSKSEDNFRFNIGTTKAGEKIKVLIPGAHKKKRKEYLEPKEFNRFIKTFGSFTSKHPNPKQHMLLMKFLCYGGLKVNELRNILLIDISFTRVENKKHMRIIVNDSKTIFIKYSLIKKEYEEYVNNRNTNSKYLFYTRTNTQYSNKSIYDLVKRFYVHSKLDATKYSVSTLLHSYAAYLYSNDVNITTISKLLGYTEIEIVELYKICIKM